MTPFGKNKKDKLFQNESPSLHYHPYKELITKKFGNNKQRYIKNIYWIEPNL